MAENGMKKTSININASFWTNRLVWLLCASVISLKCLLIRSYRSTDFEVHRNWMAITHHLPLSQWYYSNVSEWTLDYPPFFAYFEKLLSVLANYWDPAMLALQQDPYFSKNTLYFQRGSVIAVDCIYALSSIALANNIGESIEWMKEKTYLKYRLKFGLLCVLLCNSGLILLDNVHFQYNSFLYSFLFLCIVAILAGRLLTAAFLFGVLLNFKHIYLYYVPAFVFYYLQFYLWPVNLAALPKRVTCLACVLATPLLCAFGPFIYTGGMDGFQQMLSRLFPFQRGLTHAYWAPNFWSLYNFIDFLLYQVSVLADRVGRLDCNPNYMKCPLQPPMYTQGLVMEYDHSVLPNITPSISLLLVLISIVSVAIQILFFKKNGKSRGESFMVAIALSAYAFFLFGWHVHEKASLMILLPVTLLVFQDLKYLACFTPLCLGSLFSILPLFFSPLEDLVKYCLTGGYIALVAIVLFYIFGLECSKTLGKDTRLLKILMAVELYKCFIHKLVFGQALPFLPLMSVSVVCAYSICLSYSRLLVVVFGEQRSIRRAMRQCLQMEQRILAESNLEPLDDQQFSFVGGLDISACPDNRSLGVVSYTVLKYPELEVVHTSDQVVQLPYPYIPEFLAVREASILADIVLSNYDQQVDLLLVDGNGIYHSRMCGSACHVGYLTQTRSVGVAKNFNGFPMYSFGMPQKDVNQIEQRIKSNLKQAKKSAYIKVNALEPAILSVIRSSNCFTPQFVSPGYGLDLDSATRIAAKCSCLANPIRLSDLRSRALLQHIFNSN
uniref:Alpha-1,3-glucosyltransferase n=1 Tax=Ditylenchus dipsaci TaxID=166011 RepID=A0A915D8W9_9BILA